MLLRLDDRTLHYGTIGAADAPAVVMLHSLAADSGMWAEQVPALLGTGMRLVLIDMRGHGGSDNAAGATTLETLAADAFRVLDFLGVETFHHVGLSIGGMIGQAMALARPGRLLSAFWADTIGASDPALQPARDARRAAIRAAGSVEAIADATMERWFTDELRRERPGRWSAVRETVAATSVEGYLACAAAIGDFDHLGRLASLDLPVAVVCGDGDVSTPPAENRRLAETIPGARFASIPGARHLPNIERPALFNSLLLDWLKARTAAPRS